MSILRPYFCIFVPHTTNELMIIKVKRLSELTGITEYSIRRAGSRGMLVINNGNIDDNYKKNREYISKRLPNYYSSDPEPEVAKAKTKAKPVKKSKTKPVKAPTQTALVTKLEKEIERELEQDLVKKDLDGMQEQELKEQLLRERIVSTEVERKYKVKQTMLSDTKRRKMEGDLIDTEWVVATLGHGLAMYKREIKDGIDTLLSTIFSEHGIKGEDKTRYTESFIDVLAIAHKDYEYRLTKQVEAYSPDKMGDAE